MKSLSRGPSPTIPAKMPEHLVRDMDRARALLGMDRSRFIRMAVAQAIIATLNNTRGAGAL